MGRPPEDPERASLGEVSDWRLRPRPEWTSGCAISFLLDLGQHGKRPEAGPQSRVHGLVESALEPEPQRRPSSCWASARVKAQKTDRRQKRERERESAGQRERELSEAPSWRHALGGFASN